MHQCVEEREWIPVNRPKVEKPSRSEGKIVCKNQSLEIQYIREGANHSPIKISCNMISRRLKQVVRLAIYSSAPAPHKRAFHAHGNTIPDTSSNAEEFGTYSASCKHDLENRNQDSLHDERHLSIFGNDMTRFPDIAVVMQEYHFHTFQCRQAVHGSAAFFRENRGR